MVVAAQRDGATQRGGAGVARVFQHVGGPVHTRALAVPQAEHALGLGAGQQPDLLASPDGGGGQVLVDAWLEHDVVAFQVFLRRPQRDVVAAQR